MKHTKSNKSKRRHWTCSTRHCHRFAIQAARLAGLAAADAAARSAAPACAAYLCGAGQGGTHMQPGDSGPFKRSRLLSHPSWHNSSHFCQQRAETKELDIPTMERLTALNPFRPLFYLFTGCWSWRLNQNKRLALLSAAHFSELCFWRLGQYE